MLTTAALRAEVRRLRASGEGSGDPLRDAVVAAHRLGMDPQGIAEWGDLSIDQVQRWVGVSQPLSFV